MPSFTEMRQGYANMWRGLVIRSEKREVAEAIAKRLIYNRDRYEAVSKRTGVPWVWIAITHQLESGANFATHLHNGDPLSRRTTHVPKGRPVNGQPPFKWSDSAIDALEMKGLHKNTDWTIPRMLYEFERYNGFGYIARKINSPYLWSYSTHYSKGKYVRDGVFDANAVSGQIGAAVLLKVLLEHGATDAPEQPTAVPTTPPVPTAPTTDKQVDPIAALVAAVIILGVVLWQIFKN